MQKIKIYTILLNVLLILGLGSLIFIVNVIQPDKPGNIAMFYSLAGLTVFAATTLFGFHLRRLFGQREFVNAYLVSASRQGVWLAMILVTSLFMMHNGLFTWINACFLVLTFIFFESYLLTKDKTQQE